MTVRNARCNDEDLGKRFCRFGQGPILSERLGNSYVFVDGTIWLSWILWIRPSVGLRPQTGCYVHCNDFQEVLSKVGDFFLFTIWATMIFSRWTLLLKTGWNKVCKYVHIFQQCCLYFHCYTVHVVELLNHYTNHCTYIKFYTLKH